MTKKEANEILEGFKTNTEFALFHSKVDRHTKELLTELMTQVYYVVDSLFDEIAEK